MHVMLQTADDVESAKRYVYTGPAYEFIQDSGLEEKLKFVPLSMQFGKTENEGLWAMVCEAKRKGCYFISGYRKEEKYGEVRCRGEGVAPISANSAAKEWEHD